MAANGKRHILVVEDDPSITLGLQMNLEAEGYEVTFRGARPIPSDQYDRFREITLRNIFYILRQRRGEPGMTFESRGTDVIDNQPMTRCKMQHQEHNELIQ